MQWESKASLGGLQIFQKGAVDGSDWLLPQRTLLLKAEAVNSRERLGTKVHVVLTRNFSDCDVLIENACRQVIDGLKECLLGNGG